MTDNQQSTVASDSNALSRLAFFGSPPLLEGEDAKAYDQLLAGVSGAVNPSDVIEEIWTRDVVDLTWEILRWRRLKATKLTTTMSDALELLLVRPLKLPLEMEAFVGFKLTPAKELAHAWAARDSSAITRVEGLLASVGATTNTVQTRALELVLDFVERIDRLTLIAEGRRNTVLHEIDRHRDRKAFAQALRDKVRDVEDADFTHVETNLIAPN